MSLRTRLNYILTATLLTLATLAAPLAATASTPATESTTTTTAPTAASATAQSDIHLADQNGATITVPVTQIWTRIDTADDLSATYALIPETTSHQDGYTSNTEQALVNGIVTYQIGNADPNEGAFTLTGDGAETSIQFTWTSPGLYVFTLKGTNEHREHYHYDNQNYLIRLYARADGGSFLTAENESGDKVAALTFAPWFDSERKDKHQGDETPVTPTTPTTITDETTDGTSTDGTTPVTPDDATNISDTGDNIIENGVPSTGDTSHMTLYGLLVLASLAGLGLWISRNRIRNT